MLLLTGKASLCFLLAVSLDVIWLAWTKAVVDGLCSRAVLLSGAMAATSLGSMYLAFDGVVIALALVTGHATGTYIGFRLTRCAKKNDLRFV